MRNYLKSAIVLFTAATGLLFTGCAPQQQSPGISGMSMKTRTKEGRNLDIQISANQVNVTETLSNGSRIKGTGRNMTEAMKDLDQKKAGH